MASSTKLLTIPKLGAVGKYYVYFLRYPPDPAVFGKRAGTIFYIGKGTGRRVASHEAATRVILRSHRYMLLKHKHKVIIDIWDAGFQVVQEIVGRTNDEMEAYAAESNYITQVGLQHLTNSTYGYRPKGRKNPRPH